MNDIKRTTYKDVLWRVALGVTIICLIEGFIYYSKTETDILLIILLNIQNAIKAYKVDPDINLSTAYNFFMGGNLNIVERILSGIYCASLIVAPFCTMAALTMLLSAPFRYASGKRKNSGIQRKLLIIGEGEAKKKFLKTKSGAKKENDYRVYVVENAPIKDDLKISFLEKGISVIARYKDMSSEQLIKKLRLQGKDSILLCDDDPLENFINLEEIDKYYESAGIYSNGSAKVQTIYITADDAGIKNMITDFYEKRVSDVKGKGTEYNLAYDLVIVDLKANAVDKMFEKYPIHRYNDKLIKGANGLVSDEAFNVHMGIMGFGDYGRKALQSAICMSALSPTSKIVFDVFDKNIEARLGTFLKTFPIEVLKNLEPSDEDKVGEGLLPYKKLSINAACSSYGTDGNLIIRFWDTDVDTLNFTNVFIETNNDMPYTYILVAMDTDKRMAAAVIEINRWLSSISTEIIKPTVVIRSKDSGKCFEKIDAGYVMAYREDSMIYSFEALENAKILNCAKQFNCFYNKVSNIIYKYSEGKNAEDFIKLMNEEIGSELEEQISSINYPDCTEANEEWLGTNFYNRESSLAQSTHQEVKRWLAGLQMDEKHYTKRYREELEHRRWNLYMISHGYSYSEITNKKRFKHKCITTFDKLIDTCPDVLEYDYTPYRALNM